VLGAATRVEAALTTLRILADAGQPTGLAQPLLAHAAELAPLSAWVDLHLATPISIADLARQVGVSPSRLHARFQHHLGSPPMAWVREGRLLAARDRLLATADSVAAVGASCGFLDPFHFSRAFRQRFGAAPSAYRLHAGDLT